MKKLNGSKRNKEKTQPSEGSSVLDLSYEESLDFFEKIILRCQKKENFREALVIGGTLATVGFILVFQGSNFLSAIFSVLCALGLGALFASVGCLIFDCTWDSEEGVAITSMAMLVAAPFVQYALTFADKYGVPTLAGLSAFSVAEMGCKLMGISDDPYPFKTFIEILSFIIAFKIALKLQDAIRILVTAIFGSFLATCGCAVLFGKYPDTSKPMTARYGAHALAMVLICCSGIYYQKK